MKISIYILGVLLMIACVTTPRKFVSLKEAYEPYFHIGVALKPDQFNGKDERANPILERHFNSITAENHMKWMYIHPEPDSFNFEWADKFVEFGEQRGDFIVGHTLIWHSQIPDWVFKHQDGTLLTRQELLSRMEEHIKTVVGRYKGRIHGWDVVNEAINDDGSWRETPWYQIIGEDYVAKAFQFAHKADPEAELYYNDYNLHQPQKADAVVALVSSLKEQGVPITGIGMQGHYALDYPTEEQFDTSIRKFKQLGTVAITELDVDVLPAPDSYIGADVNRTMELQENLNPYTQELPDSIRQLQQKKFSMLFTVMLNHADAINRVTLWGVTDGDSWKNDWPVPGRRNYPLLFDRNGKPKSVVETIIGLTKAKEREY